MANQNQPNQQRNAQQQRPGQGSQVNPSSGNTSSQSTGGSRDSKNPSQQTSNTSGKRSEDMSESESEDEPPRRGSQHQETFRQESKASPDGSQPNTSSSAVNSSKTEAVGRGSDDVSRRNIERVEGP